MTEFDSLERQFQDYNVTTHREPGRIPTRDKITSAFGLGPMHPLQIVKADALVAEANRTPAMDRDTGLTHAEQVVLAGPVRTAKAGLEKQVRGPIEKQIHGIKDLFARINVIDQQIDRSGQIRLVGPNGEQLAPEEAQDVHDTLRDRVVRETNEGSKKHHIRREGRGAKAKEVLLLAIDLPIFIYAMCSLLNVSLRLVFTGDGPTLINFAVAAVFGLLGTVLFATLMRSMGRRHRRFKGHDSSLETATRTSGIRLRTEQAATLCILIAVAYVMGARIVDEGAQAEANMGLVVPLAIALGLLVAVSGYVNYQGEYENGSEETDRVGHLSAQLGGYTAYVEGLHQQRAVLMEAAGKAIAELSRMITKTKEHARQAVLTSIPYKTTAIARSYASITDPIVVPEPASEALDQAQQQAAELAAHHAHLARNTNQEN